MFTSHVSRRRATCAAAASVAIAFVLGGCPPTDPGTGQDSPLIATIAPTSGPTAGGTKVTIRGAAFPEDAVVLFGGQTPGTLNRVNSTLLEAITAPQGAGVVNVEVVDAGGALLAVAGQFEFVAPALPPPTPEPTPEPVPVMESVSPSQGIALGGTKVTIRGQNFKPGSAVIFGSFLGESTQVVSDQVITSITPAQAVGKVNVIVITPQKPAISLANAFEYLDPGLIDDGVALRVVGALSRNNKEVLVTFSKLLGDGASDARNYSVGGTDSAFLVVTAAAIQPDGKSVLLTTLTQDFDLYTVHVVGVKDYFGRPMAAPDGILAPPDGIDPSRASFRGTAPTAAEIDFDTDGDGFGDWFEMKGWLCTVKFANGTVSTGLVTSDPFNPDTDGDGIDDSVENQNSWDPRTNDTDADQIDDWSEFNIYYTDPANQDSDGDTFGDHLEITFFRTSPILADTDGDQLTDDDEVLNRNRNPLVADLPLIGVQVGDVALRIDQRYSYTDQFGRSQTFEQSFNNTLQRDSTRSNSETSASSFSGFFEGKVHGAGGYDAQKQGWFELGLDVGGGFTKEDSHSSTTESSESMSSTFNQAVSQGTQLSSTSDVSRETVGAELAATVTLRSAGDIAFTIRDLEISVLQTDPRDRTRLIPIATIVPNNPEAAFNLGPLNPERGPFIFKNSDIFPSLVEELMKDPRGLVFKVANYNMTDEIGRNFAFSGQEIVERTANIVIDYGTGRTDRFRVATASTFDLDGKPVGISVEDALRSIGITQWRSRTTGEVADDPELDKPGNPKRTDADILSSYGTRLEARVVNGETVDYRRVTRIRDVQQDFDFDTIEPIKINDGAFWAVFFFDPLNPNPNNDPNNPTGNATTDFGAVRLRAGQTYVVAFVQDKDKDGLTSREEFLTGSSDVSQDTDNDGLTDPLEIRGEWNADALEPWIVGTDRRPGGYRAYGAPYSSNSDGDALSDAAEYGLCLYSYDPNGMPLASVYTTGTFAESDPDPNNPIVVWANGVTPASLPNAFPPDGGLPMNWYAIDADDDGIPDQFPTNRASLDPRKTDTDEDGVSDSDEVNGYYITLFDNDPLDSEKERVFVRTDPRRSDTDRDGLIDGMERLFGTNPAASDTGVIFDDDQDGLPNRVEEVGWLITVDGTQQRVYSNPDDPDSDNDLIPDYVEYVIGTNPWYWEGQTVPPNAAAPGFDTDSDGLDDFLEWDGIVEPQKLDLYNFCQLVPNCNGFAPNPNAFGTNPLAGDSDGDGLSDNFETNVGWQVSVFGAPSSYQVYSDPLDPDTDNDGWADGQEQVAGADPAKDDTDDDGLADPIEWTYTTESGSARSPLVADRRIRVTFVYFRVIEDGITNGPGFYRWFLGTVSGNDFNPWFQHSGYSLTPDCGNGIDSFCYECAVAQFNTTSTFEPRNYTNDPNQYQRSFIVNRFGGYVVLDGSLRDYVNAGCFPDELILRNSWYPFSGGSYTFDYYSESRAIYVESPPLAGSAKYALFIRVFVD